MKKFRFIFLVLALILVVGMTTGVIVRKQTGSQTVLQHSGASAPASTTPATTGDDEPAAPEEPSPVLGLLDFSVVPLYVNVPPEGLSVEICQNGETLEPVSRVEVPYDSGALSGAKPADHHYNEVCDLYFVDRSSSVTIRLLSNSKGGDISDPGYYTVHELYFTSEGEPDFDVSIVSETSYTVFVSTTLILYLDFYNTIQID